MFTANFYNVDRREQSVVGRYATNHLALDAISTFVLMCIPDTVQYTIVCQPYGFDVWQIKRKKTSRKEFCKVSYIHLYRCFIKRERD